MKALTPKQQALGDLVMEGLRYREIAERLGRSEKGVRTDLHKLRQKTGTHSKTALAVYLYRASLTKRPEVAK